MSFHSVFLVILTCRTVNGSTYHGVAKERARAAQEFQDRLQAGENVGLVEARYTAVS